MALIKCTQCGHEISDKASVCPKCGNKMVIIKEKKDTTTKILIAVVLLVLLTCGAFFFLYKDANVDTAETDNINETNRYDRSNAKLLKIVKVEYSNSLAPQAGNNYEAKNLCDGDSATAWAINLDKAIFDNDMLYGPMFTVSCKKLSHIIMRNGYCKNADAFKNNARAAKVVFYNYVEDAEGDDERILYDGSLKDKPMPQRLEIPLDLDNNNDIKQIGMNFSTQLNGGFFAGAKWNDLCISEVEFWGFE